MKEVILDAAGWTTTEDFYVAYLAAVGAPVWHGYNFDALWDSLSGGDINEVNPPFRVRIVGTAGLNDECQRILNHFDDLLFDARARGVIVDLIRD